MLAALVLGGIGGGCVDEKSKSDLDPAGNPKILQVFVNDGDDSDDPFGYATYTLTYGIHPDAYKCSFDKTCAEESGLTCATSGDLAGHCVDSSGAQPIAFAAPPLGISIRIVSKELLDGKTLEEFVCACQGAPNGCPEGKDFSIDPANCSVCGDDADTDATMKTGTSEAGRCLDLDQDGLPDASGLQAGIATIACTGSATSFAPYTTEAGDGYYYPSGNQFPTSTQGYGGLGPAIVLEPPSLALPADVDCTVQLTAMAKDKDGHSFDAPSSPPTFHTAAMGAASTSPANNAANVADNLASILVNYNTIVAASSATKAGAVTVTDAGGTALAGIVVTVPAATPFRIKIDTSGSTLKAATKYTVKVTGITDTYGQPAADKTFSFTTK